MRAAPAAAAGTAGRRGRRRGRNPRWNLRKSWNGRRRRTRIAAPRGIDARAHNRTSGRGATQPQESLEHSTPVDGGVNAFGLHWQCGVDAEGNLYFGAVPPAGGTDNDIYVARRLDGSYAVPSRHPISTDLEETTPFVDPAGGYVIVSRVGPTGGHLAVSFRASDGSWTDPTEVSDNISPDGQTASSGRVALNDNGDALIVWRQFDGTDARIFRSEYRFGF